MTLREAGGPSEGLVLAADLGGTKMLAALIDAQGGVHRLHEAPTPAARGGEEVLKALADLLHEVRGTARPQALGLSLAGVIDGQHLRVLDATDALPGWAGIDLARGLAGLGLPIAARNDVHAALLGEAWLGGLRGRRDGMLLTFGTGLGGAFLVEGVLHTGGHQLAGHVGRTEVWHEGARWPLDALLSGTGLVRLHGAVRDGRAFFEQLRLGDARAEQAMAVWLDQLTLLLHNLHWLLDPGCVVLGGGLIDVRELWWERLLPRLAGLPLEVRPAELGSRAGLLGAGLLAWQRHDAEAA